MRVARRVGGPPWTARVRHEASRLFQVRHLLLGESPRGHATRRLVDLGHVLLRQEVADQCNLRGLGLRDRQGRHARLRLRLLSGMLSGLPCAAPGGHRLLPLRRLAAGSSWSRSGTRKGSGARQELRLPPSLHGGPGGRFAAERRHATRAEVRGWTRAFANRNTHETIYGRWPPPNGWFIRVQPLDTFPMQIEILSENET
eukprot:5605407-Prymnesium_polylepis.2